MIVKDDGSARTVKGENCVDLLINGSANEFVLVKWPDGKDTSDSKVGINDGWAVQRVVCDNILFIRFLGVILWIMLFNKYPFGNSAHDNTVYENIVKGCDPEFSIEEAFKIQDYKDT